jgi:hypothetical protein
VVSEDRSSDAFAFMPPIIASRRNRPSTLAAATAR